MGPSMDSEALTPIVQDSNGTTLEEVLIRHFLSVRYEQLAGETIDIAKGIILDTFGAMIAAGDEDDIVRLTKLITDWAGAAEARIVGVNGRVPAHHAALVNGAMARALEIDEVHEKALLHSAASLVPVALAVADQAGQVSGKEFLTALVLGMDLSARFSLCQMNDVTTAGASVRGMSYTYQTGILIGALVAARLMRLSEAETRDVLGIAYSQCAGNQQGLLEGVLTVRVQQGLSAMTAVMSARLAAIGVSGAKASLEGPAGYFAAFHGNRFLKKIILDGLGQRFESDQASIKPYPGCKFTHTSISAALEIRSSDRFSVQNMERVVVTISNREYFDIVCKPEDVGERRRQLAGGDGFVRAQFCLAYLVAVALIYGGVDLTHYSEQVRGDEVVLSLMDKVETIMIASAPATTERVLPSPGLVEVYFKGQAQPLVSRVAFPKGHPNNRMDYREITEKFLRMTGARSNRIPLDSRRNLVAQIDSIVTCDDVSRLLDGVT